MINEVIRQLRALTLADGADRIYKAMVDAADEIEGLLINSECWEKIAREMAKELGKVEYADAKYADLKGQALAERYEHRS